MVLSLIMAQNNVPAADEVFSALNFAALPTFHTLSFYPLPNNHPLFNVMAGFLQATSLDGLVAGRIVAFLAYAAANVLIFLLLRRLFQSSTVAVLGVLVIALQLPVWGFSTQGRGYTLVLLVSVLAIYSFLRFVEHKQAKALIGLALANWIGMLIVPSHLYFWLGLWLAGCWILPLRKPIFFHFFVANVGTGLATFLSYLPLLSFSGLAAVASNRYVEPAYDGPLELIGSLPSYLGGLFNEWFLVPYWWLGLVLLVLPALLLIFMRRQGSLIVIAKVQLGQVAAFLLLSLLLYRLPFYRNLIAQSCLSLLVLLCGLLSALKPIGAKRVAFVVFPLLAGVEAAVNHQRIPRYLYYYPVHESYQSLLDCPVGLAEGDTVLLMEQGFLWAAALKEKYPEYKNINIDLNRAAFQQQLYLIARPQEYTDTVNYEKIMDCAGFGIWKRKGEPKQ